MRRFYLFKDGVQKGSMETRAEALEMIHLWQSREHPSLLRSQFSIIGGEEASNPLSLLAETDHAETGYGAIKEEASPMNDRSHDTPASRQRIEEQTELVGRWEDARRVPDQKRLTWFYPDFGSYVLNYYVTAEQLDAAAKEVERQKALAAERRRNRKQHERQER